MEDYRRIVYSPTIVDLLSGAGVVEPRNKVFISDVPLRRYTCKLNFRKMHSQTG